MTNGLGGYASGTISGAVTRRYHGLLIAALPTPFGRTVMLNYVWEQIRFGDGRVVALPSVFSTTDGNGFDCSRYLAAFRLEAGLPVWEATSRRAVREARADAASAEYDAHFVFALCRPSPCASSCGR